jgi:CBS domain-containing protein
MKVGDVMCRPVASCAENTVLSAAAKLMAENDCGALPVLRAGKIVGMITDRDICLAIAKEKPPGEATVGKTMTRMIATLQREDDVHAALATMASRRVRRLPVEDGRGRLCGILSLDDLVIRAEEPSPIGPVPLSYHDVFETFRSICGRRPIRKSA